MSFCVLFWRVRSAARALQGPLKDQSKSRGVRQDLRCLLANTSQFFDSGLRWLDSKDSGLIRSFSCSTSRSNRKTRDAKHPKALFERFRWMPIGQLVTWKGRSITKSDHRKQSSLLAGLGKESVCIDSINSKARGPTLLVRGKKC